MFEHIYHNRKVLITGHTVSKSWLPYGFLKWAQRSRLFLEPQRNPTIFTFLIWGQIHYGDVRDLEKLKQVFKEQQRDLFHLAAQLSSGSYKDRWTFTACFWNHQRFEALRESGTFGHPSTSPVICYVNRDGLGGTGKLILRRNMTYSARKDALSSSQLLRQSFFNLKDYGSAHKLSGSGRQDSHRHGDWAIDRLSRNDACRKPKWKVKIRKPTGHRHGSMFLNTERIFVHRKGYWKSERNFRSMELWTIRRWNQRWVRLLFRYKRLPKWLWNKYNSRSNARGSILRLDVKSPYKIAMTPVWDRKTRSRKRLSGIAFYEYSEAKAWRFHNYFADEEANIFMRKNEFIERPCRCFVMNLNRLDQRGPYTYLCKRNSYRSVE